MKLISNLWKPFADYWHKYFNFTGTTNRKFFVTVIIELILLSVIINGLIRLELFGWGLAIGIIVPLLMIVPSLSLGVRRLRDVGLSPWLVLI